MEETLTELWKRIDAHWFISPKDRLEDKLTKIEWNVHNAIVRKYGNLALKYEKNKFRIRKLWTIVPYCGLEVFSDEQKELYVDYSSLVRGQDKPVKIYVYNKEQEDLARNIQERLQGFVGSEITITNSF